MCRPTRTWIGPDASSSVNAAAAEIAPGALREGEEESVSLRVDLDPALSCAGRADHAPVLGEGLCIVLGAK